MNGRKIIRLLWLLAFGLAALLDLIAGLTHLSASLFGTFIPNHSQYGLGSTYLIAAIAFWEMRPSGKLSP